MTSILEEEKSTGEAILQQRFEELRIPMLIVSPEFLIKHCVCRQKFLTTGVDDTYSDSDAKGVPQPGNSPK